jgi:hypothetical protein
VQYGKAGTEALLPYTSLIVSVLSGALALGLAWSTRRACLRQLLRNCAIVEAVPILILAVLDSLANRALSVRFLDYGVAFLFSVPWQGSQSRAPLARA